MPESHCLCPGTYPCLTAQVTLKREIGYYITQSYIPTILIVILSWAAFWIDHEAVPARISVGLLTVLTITTQLSGSRAQLPRVPYIKVSKSWRTHALLLAVTLSSVPPSLSTPPLSPSLSPILSPPLSPPLPLLFPLPPSPLYRPLPLPSPLHTPASLID